MLFAAILIAGTVQMYLQVLVNRTILRDAEEKAVHWAEDFVTQVPDLETLAVEGRPTREQIDAVGATLAGGDIFRFKLFSDHGDLKFISDEARFIAEGSDTHSDKARETVLSGINNVSVQDGRQKPGRPDTYVEAYVPVVSSSGKVFGVVEVYVDVSALASNLSLTFRSLSIGILLISALVFLVPSAILINRNNRLRAKDQELIEITKFDTLTGLLNRGAFSERLAEMFESRNARQATIGLLFIDVDRFKEANDTFGHEFGDALLRYVAHTIKSVAREADLIARMGGDEFVVAIEVNDLSEAHDFGSRILANVRRPFTFKNTSISPDLSIGVHVSPPGELEQDALHAADLALYKAKADGRGRICSYSKDLNEAVMRRRYVEACIKNGMQEDHFFLEYQPIFGTQAHDIVGFEALLRLRTAIGDHLAPAEFIPVAEATGSIVDIGDWVLRTALNDAASWPEHTYVSVNLSILQLRADDAVARIRQALAQSGVSPARLELEITESMLIENEENIGRKIVELRALGVSIALDDFGTGYSSLGYLWRYQFDKIKIDRVFLEGYDFSPETYEGVFDTLIMLGHKMGFKVTAEGVEHNDQVEMLVRNRCDQFQGYLLGEPMSPRSAQAAVESETGDSIRSAGDAS